MIQSVKASPRQEIESDGFTLLEQVLSVSTIDRICAVIESVGNGKSGAGLRNLLMRSDEILELASSDFKSLAKQFLNKEPKPVRAILFDKTPASNWYVTWHQDLTIPVQRRLDIPGFTAWSTKDGVIHTQPPLRILEQMVSLRLHLDDCAEDNGAIKFIQGSHTMGILSAAEIEQLRKERPEIALPARAGDVIAMRPLTLHSSSTSTKPRQRRVLHIEYTASSLPGGLEWARA